MAGFYCRKVELDLREITPEALFLKNKKNALEKEGKYALRNEYSVIKW